MQRLTVGDATLVRVDEMIDTSFTAAGFFPAFAVEALHAHLDWLVPRYDVPERDALVLSMHSWVVRTGRHTVLIDACIGNDKDRLPRRHWHRLRTPFLERLVAAGTKPEDVDYVMCTHMHADHHPIQVYHPDWSAVACFDPVASAVSRRRLLEHCCASGALLLPAHFAAPHGGRVLQAGDGFAFQWLGAEQPGAPGAPVSRARGGRSER